MNNQRTIFEGDVLRDEALARVERAAHQEWMTKAKGAVAWLASQRPVQITSEDVWELMEAHYPELSTTEPRAMGVVFQWAKRQRVLEPTGTFVKAKRSTRHSGPMRVWKPYVA